MTPSDARAQAFAESRFFGHLFAFAVVTSVLLGINLVLGGSVWAAWVGVAWALLVVSHAAAVFGHVLGSGWVERRAASLQVVLHAEALRQIDRRLWQIESETGGLPQADALGLDPFDLDSASAVGRPIAPEWIGAPREDHPANDPFAMSREPIDTPRLDGPRPHAKSAV